VKLTTEYSDEVEKRWHCTPF